MFMGEYNHTIDAKGRLIIPSKFRELLGEEFVLTKGLDGCLSIYPMDEWEAFEEKLRRNVAVEEYLGEGGSSQIARRTVGGRVARGNVGAVKIVHERIHGNIVAQPQRLGDAPGIRCRYVLFFLALRREYAEKHE